MAGPGGIGDSSTFSIVDAAIWDALKEQDSTAGTELSDWRREQRVGAGKGKDFSVKEVPDLDKIKDTDTPALIAVNGGALSQGTAGADFEELVYTRRILGVVRGGSDETTQDQKCKKFGELCWNLLAHHRQNCFGDFITGTNPIKKMDIVHLVFPEILQPVEVFMFDLGLEFQIEITNR